MPDVARLLQAFVSPAIFVSAAALLLLSLNNRLMGIVTRLRQFHREKLGTARAGRLEEAEALDNQIRSIEGRAEHIRKACLLTLVSLAGTITTCLLLGLGLYWQFAQVLAAYVLVLSVLCLWVATLFYIAEITVALSSVRDEAKFFHLVDPGTLARTERRERRDEDG